MTETKALQRLIKDTPQSAQRYALAGYLLGVMHAKYSEDQPRDDAGRWSDTGGGGSGGGSDGGDGESGGDSGSSTGVVNKEKALGTAKDTAQQLGFHPDNVIAGGPGHKVKIGGEESEIAAEFNPATGKVTIYDGVLSDPDTSFVKGVVAHEVNHAKFMEVHEAYDAERTSLMFDKEKLDSNGEVLAKYRKEYPTYNALHKYIDGDKVGILGKEDGVTNYSKIYWKGKQKKGGKLKLAIDETLAEIAYLKIQGKGEGISDTWNALDGAVHAQYKRIKK